MIEKIRGAHVRTLCTLARGDAETLQYPLPDFVFGFHAQQAFEKSMKALLAGRGERYPKTHRLDELKGLLSLCGEQMPVLSYDLLRLQSFAVESRYDDGDSLTAAQRVAIREAVLVYNQHVLARILEFEAAAGSLPEHD